MAQVLEQNHYDHCSSWDSNGADGADKDDDEEECEYDTDDDWAPDENLGHSQLIGKVSDHRPLNLNADDYLRCYHVPREKNANFRLFPGVISHNDGQPRSPPWQCTCASWGWKSSWICSMASACCWRSAV